MSSWRTRYYQLLDSLQRPGRQGRERRVPRVRDERQPRPAAATRPVPVQRPEARTPRVREPRARIQARTR